MGRIRTLKPDFWTSPTVMSLPSLRQIITFAGLITAVADDKGRLRDDAELIWGAIWVKRRREVDVEDVVEDLTILNTHMRTDRTTGLVVRYEKKGMKLLWIPSFLEHQRISHPTPSKLPPPPRISRNLRSDSGGLFPDLIRSGSGSGEGSGSGTRARKTPRRSADNGRVPHEDPDPKPRGEGRARSGSDIEPVDPQRAIAEMKKATEPRGRGGSR